MPLEVLKNNLAYGIPTIYIRPNLQLTLGLFHKVNRTFFKVANFYGGDLMIEC